MTSRIRSAAIFGIDAVPLEVEVDIRGGLPTVVIVGLPDAAVREARDRVRSAILARGHEFPRARVTVNLAPADTRKEGPLHDLAIALGILLASGQVSPGRSCDAMVVGELALDGRVRPVRGALAIAAAARELGATLLCPRENAAEARLVEGVEVHGVADLAAAAAWIDGALLDDDESEDDDGRLGIGAGGGGDAADARLAASMRGSTCVDLVEIRGQSCPKRALEVAAAGGHGLLLVGPPGGGKTMLAQALPGILPSPGPEEALGITRIWSVAGLLDGGHGLLVDRPFRAPHHTASGPALVGGGRPIRPGEVSLAHGGVLFLDELPEFPRSVLEALRQPLEEGVIRIGRAEGNVTYPAGFQLIAAANPCPCGFLGDRRRACRCTPRGLDRYRERLSGPLLDRIDLHVEVPALTGSDLGSAPPRDRGVGETGVGTGAEGSAAVRARVTWARRRQEERHRSGGAAASLNARRPPRDIVARGEVVVPALEILSEAVDALGLSARGWGRALRVARTIADLAGEERVSEAHVSEALGYRLYDRVATRWSAPGVALGTA